MINVRFGRNNSFYSMFVKECEHNVSIMKSRSGIANEDFWDQQITFRHLITIASIMLFVGFLAPWYCGTMSFSSPWGIEHSSDDDSAFKLGILFFRLVLDGAPPSYLAVSALYLPLFLCPAIALVLGISTLIHNTLPRKKVTILSIIGIVAVMPFLFWHFCGSLFVTQHFSPVSFSIVPLGPALTISSFVLMLLCGSTRMKQSITVLLTLAAFLICYVVLTFAPVA